MQIDEAKIKDPEASKPDDWDEDAPKQILDMEAEMPEGWLEVSCHEIRHGSKDFFGLSSITCHHKQFITNMALCIH